MSAETSNIEAMVMEIVEKQMHVKKERINHKTTFINDLGADSLDLAELHMELEIAFDLNIPNEDAEKIFTFGDAVDYIRRYDER